MVLEITTKGLRGVYNYKHKHGGVKWFGMKKPTS